MHGWFDRLYAVLGAAPLGMGVFIVISSGLDSLPVVLGLFVIALILLSVPRWITVDETGVTSRQLFCRIHIAWEDAAEIGLGGDTRRGYQHGLWNYSDDPAGWADRAAVYVSPRELTDVERVSILSVRREVVWFPYLGQLAPRAGASAQLKAAMVRFCPGALPGGMLPRTDNRSFAFTYVLRRRDAEGRPEPVFGIIDDPAQAYRGKSF